ncbi:WYL domain-containing protein [Neorhizobium sp. T786]|uniref:WYL domain-containing protein n=1 Tax=Pseudorhizobium xiangyangii TaxID=2883104 RepID=UPI001CFF84F5|nr:WYL domain-containing protein [Neorhizobium xiangyangii]MCB5201696.1 WYL domain-containing protein [Neorhizobium xiangyangii]
MTETHSEKGIPLDGAVALRCGFGSKANPFPKGTWQSLRWLGEWYTENAACFRSHVESRPVFMNGGPLTFSYRNWRGEIGTRNVQPVRLEYGATTWHPVPQWLLIGWDIDRAEERSFAIADINPSPEGETPPPESHVDVEDVREQKLATIVAPDNGTPHEVLSAVLACARAWVPEARIVGNVRAGDIVRAIEYLPAPETNVQLPRDISTAPKMTDVLVWWPIVKLDDDGEPTDEVVDGRWLISEDQGYWIEPEVMNAIGDHLGDDFTYADKPSHWMPLPTALFTASEDK